MGIRTAEHGPTVQRGIMAPRPPLGRYLTFALESGGDPASSLKGLLDLVDGDEIVVGIGRSLVEAVGGSIPGHADFPAFSGRGIDVPSTPSALWCWLRGEDRGELVHRTRRIEEALAPGLALDSVVDSFLYRGGLDLTGYEDGTENPTGNEAAVAAVVEGAEAGLDGGSFVAVQQWMHDLDRFESMTSEDQDHTIGRRRSDNEELGDAPESAHVKRTAQEDFEPEAFLLRQCMPWADEAKAGLMFVAFGRSFAAFSAQLSRMVGEDDGVVDAVFTISRRLTGAYFWCPPMADGRLDLSALGL